MTDTSIVAPSLPEGRSAIAIGAAVFVLVSASFALCALALLFGARISPWSSSAIILSASGAALWTARTIAPRTWLFTWGMLGLLITISLVASSLVIDTSVDGQNYHFVGTTALAGGWRPLYEQLEMPFRFRDVGAQLWVAHYPQASWIVGAMVQEVLGSTEASKFIGLLLWLGVTMLAIGTMRTVGFSWQIAWAVGAVAAANPVALTQISTRLNDGVLASSYCALLLIAMLYLRERSRWSLAVAFLIVVFAINLKFSAIPVLIMLSAFICGAAWLKGQWRAAMPVAVVLGAAGAVGTAVVGFAPYGTNFVTNGHPFYPVMGEGKVDIMTSNMPPVLAGMSSSSKFVYSLFATTSSGYDEPPPPLKLPFRVTAEEIRAAGGVDARIGGFGPLMSGALLLGLVLAGLILARSNMRRRASWALYGAGALVFTVLIMPENWWARYIPQLWLVMVALAIAGLITSERIPRILAWGIIVTLGINALMCGVAAQALAIKRSKAAQAQISRLAAAGTPVDVEFELAIARLPLMRRAGIDVRPVSTSCTGPEQIVSYGPDRIGGRVCPRRRTSR